MKKNIRRKSTINIIPHFFYSSVKGCDRTPTGCWVDWGPRLGWSRLVDTGLLGDSLLPGKTCWHMSTTHVCWYDVRVLCCTYDLKKFQNFYFILKNYVKVSCIMLQKVPLPLYMGFQLPIVHNLINSRPSGYHVSHTTFS